MQGQNPLRQGRWASHGNSKLGKQSKYELEQKMNGKLQRKTINGIWCRMTLSRQPMTTIINIESTKTSAARTLLQFSSKCDFGCGHLNFLKDKTILWQSHEILQHPQNDLRLKKVSPPLPIWFPCRRTWIHVCKTCSIFCKKRLAHQCVYYGIEFDMIHVHRGSRKKTIGLWETP